VFMCRVSDAAHVVKRVHETAFRRLRDRYGPRKHRAGMSPVDPAQEFVEECRCQAAGGMVQ
jgi:hypothetical protein